MESKEQRWMSAAGLNSLPRILVLPGIPVSKPFTFSIKHQGNGKVTEKKIRYGILIWKIYKEIEQKRQINQIGSQLESQFEKYQYLNTTSSRRSERRKTTRRTQRSSFLILQVLSYIGILAWKPLFPYMPNIKASKNKQANKWKYLKNQLFSPSSMLIFFYLKLLPRSDFYVLETFILISMEV